MHRPPVTATDIAAAVFGAAALALILTTGVIAGVYQEISRKEPQR